MYNEIVRESDTIDEALKKLRDLLGRKLNFVERSEIEREFKRIKDER